MACYICLSVYLCITNVLDCHLRSQYISKMRNDNINICTKKTEETNNGRNDDDDSNDRSSKKEEVEKKERSKIRTEYINYPCT